VSRGAGHADADGSVPEDGIGTLAETRFSVKRRRRNWAIRLLTNFLV
jgi:hypothetical protein